MTREERYKITNKDYLDIQIRYNGNPSNLDRYKEFSPHIMNDNFAIIYVPVAQITSELLSKFGYSAIPHCYGLTNEQSLEASGVTKLQIVPSMDENGHGTMLAGIAAGSENEQNNFSGVAPDADLIIVKLKQAKSILTNYYSIPNNIVCYQENDIAWALEYIVYKARSMKRSVAICIGLGTSQGAHDNTGFLNSIVSVVADFSSVCISVSAGNEGNLRRHFYSDIDPSKPPVPVELNVSENDSGFTLELWGDPPVVYSLDILSPSGEYIPKIYVSLVHNQEITFISENTVINIDSFIVEVESGKQVIVLRFKYPSPGIWIFKVYGKGDLKGKVNIWLPSDGFISKNTYFLNSDPYTTITSPGNCIVPITLTAYNSNNNKLFVEAGKGFSTSNIINPDLAAPGVDLQCPALDHSFTTLTGTSAATAHTTGITALILEWSIVRNNYPGIDTVGIKKFLIRGANRSSQLQYPNQEWGYGIIDVYNSFNLLRTDIENI
jgi:subtilisin family serine protease